MKNTYTNKEGIIFVFSQNTEGQTQLQLIDGEVTIDTNTLPEVAEELRRLTCDVLQPITVEQAKEILYNLPSLPGVKERHNG